MILHESNWQNDTVRHLPMEGLLFPSLLEPEPIAKPQSDLSCSDLVENGAQHLLVNDWMATVIGSYTYKLLHRQPIRTFMTFIDADDGTVAGKTITRDNLLAYLNAGEVRAD
jgi:hypothetical protein